MEGCVVEPRVSDKCGVFMRLYKTNCCPVRKNKASTRAKGQVCFSDAFNTEVGEVKATWDRDRHCETC